MGQRTAHGSACYSVALKADLMAQKTGFYSAQLMAAKMVESWVSQMVGMKAQYSEQTRGHQKEHYWVVLTVVMSAVSWE